MLNSRRFLVSSLTTTLALLFASNALGAARKSKFSGKKEKNQTAANIRAKAEPDLVTSDTQPSITTLPTSSENPTNIVAQQNSTGSSNPFNYRISTNPLGLAIWGTLNLAAEFRINSQLSAGPELYYRSYGYSDVRTTFYGVGGNIRKTFQNDDVFSTALYAKGFANYYTLRFSSDYTGEKSNYSWNLYTLGGTAGYQWFLNNGVNFELGGGLQYTYINFGDYVGNKFYLGGVWPAFDASIGYSF